MAFAKRRLVVGAVVVTSFVVLFRDAHILRVDGKGTSSTRTTNEVTAVPETMSSESKFSAMAVERSNKIPSVRQPVRTEKGDRDTNPCAGKEKLVSILEEANVTAFNSVADNEELCYRLPSWKSITDLYGKKPVIIGLERCEQYKSIVGAYDNSDNNAGLLSHPPSPRIGGLYNTGTNALAWYFLENIENIGEKDLLGQLHPYELPWGKHTSATHRLNVTFPQNNTESPYFVLPIILLRDPYRWMQSMCKRPYFVRGFFGAGSCPKLVTTVETNKKNQDNEARPVEVKLTPPPLNGKVETYSSLAAMWSTWNRQYYDAEYPRLVIRFEDLLFHTREVMDTIVKCSGITPSYNMGARSRPQDRTIDESHAQFHEFRYHVDAAKGHGISTDMVSAMIKYGNDRGRSRRYSKEDLDYAQIALDKELMDVFHYSHPQEVMPT